MGRKGAYIVTIMIQSAYDSTICFPFRYFTKKFS